MSDTRKCNIIGCKKVIDRSRDMYFEMQYHYTGVGEKPKNKYYYCYDCFIKNIVEHSAKGDAWCILEHTTLVIKGKKITGEEIAIKAHEAVNYLLELAKDIEEITEDILQNLKVKVLTYMADNLGIEGDFIKPINEVMGGILLELLKHTQQREGTLECEVAHSA